MKPSCQKVGYRSRIDALLVLAKIQAKDSPTRPKQERRAYMCPRCRRWHLTSVEAVTEP